MVVLGLFVLMGLSLVVLFRTVAQNDALVEKGIHEAQDILLGKAALSLTVARANKDPLVAEGWRSDRRLGTDSLGFRVRVRPRGLFPFVEAEPTGRIRPTLRSTAELARSWHPSIPIGLVLLEPGDVILGPTADLSGGIVASGGVRRFGSFLPPSHVARDSNALASWLRSGLDTAHVGAWQSQALDLLEGRSDSLAGEPVTGKLSDAPGGHLAVPRGLWIWTGSSELDSLDCDRCVLLASRLRLRNGARMRGGLLWTSGSLVLRGRLSGDGQFLSRDGLDLDSLAGSDPGIVLASLGRACDPIDPTCRGWSTASVGMRGSVGSGLVARFGVGERGSPGFSVLATDERTDWTGIVVLEGLVDWQGRLQGTLVARQLLGLRPDGVLQGGYLHGSVAPSPTTRTLLFPWSGARDGDVALRRWEHASP
jgi:hypothetical protein